MRALTVETLVKKGRLEPEVAVAVAEAMDQTIVHAELVTVPILDARLAISKADFDARFAAFSAQVDARFAAFSAQVDVRFAAFSAQVDARFAAFSAEVDGRFEAFSATIDARFAALRSEFTAFKAEIEARFATLQTRIILWIVGSNLGTAYLPKVAALVGKWVSRAVA